MELSLVLLAAGASRRMGRDKRNLELGGKTLFQRALDLMGSFPEAVSLVVTNDPALAEQARARDFLVVPNPRAEEGMGTSVAAAAEVLFSRFVIFFNCDQPFLDHDCVAALLACAQATNRIVVPRCQGRLRSPCVFPRRFYSELAQLSGDRGGKMVYARHPDEVYYLEFPDPRPFQDVDTPEEWEQVLKQHD